MTIPSINTFLRNVPTTKVRVLVTLALSAYVVISTVTRNYDPSLDILAFLLVSMGLDITQYFVRKNAGTTTTTTQELPSDEQG